MFDLFRSRSLNIRVVMRLVFVCVQLLVVGVHIHRSKTRLAPEAFGKGTIRCSLDLEGICTTKQNTDYWSPVVANGGLPYADLAVLVEAHSLRDPTIIEAAGMGCFCNANARMIFMREGAGARNFSWQHGLTFYPDSVALSWPVSIVKVPGNKHCEYIEFNMQRSFFSSIVLG